MSELKNISLLILRISDQFSKTRNKLKIILQKRIRL